MKYTHIICHYGEIGLKGGNRKFFEQKLKNNIKTALKNENAVKNIQLLPGRILIKLTSNEDLGNTRKRLGQIFGIVNFSFVHETKQDLKILKKTAWEMAEDKKFKSFRISAIRSQKELPFTSMDINREVGAHIVLKSGAKVNLEKPALNIFIELINNRAFFYSEKLPGPGGLPVGSSGKVMVLLSGGIDSPVAAYYLLKRGCPVEYIHFHSIPYTSVESVIKVKKLATTLKEYGGTGKIYSVPFADAQKHIMVSTEPKYRVILYRRFMMKIAEQIAKKEKCLAFVTGESVGQVASQTIENIFVTEASTTYPILRPLIGMDKEEIMNKAKVIGTYDISILPHDDCCTRFIPKHPETKADLSRVLKEEKKLDEKKIISKAIKDIKIEEV